MGKRGENYLVEEPCHLITDRNESVVSNLDWMVWRPILPRSSCQRDCKNNCIADTKSIPVRHSLKISSLSV